jgi:hypothetical protein
MEGKDQSKNANFWLLALTYFVASAGMGATINAGIRPQCEIPERVSTIDSLM